jgi:ZIP family zinc transporter
MAFGAGVLISAVSFELVEDAFETAGTGGVAAGLAAGALAFFAGDAWLDRRGGADRKRSRGARVPAAGAGVAIVLGIVLDGVPETAVIGLTVLQQGEVSVAMLVAVFLSNFPEAIAATTGLRTAGWAAPRILGLWALVMAASGLAALLGYALLDDASDRTVAFVLSFAAGSILTMLADTMMPEAFEHGGRRVGLLTTLGFCVAFLVSSVE